MYYNALVIQLDTIVVHIRVKLTGEIYPSPSSVFGRGVSHLIKFYFAKFIITHILFKNVIYAFQLGVGELLNLQYSVINY